MRCKKIGEKIPNYAKTTRVFMSDHAKIHFLFKRFLNKRRCVCY